MLCSASVRVKTKLSGHFLEKSKESSFIFNLTVSRLTQNVAKTDESRIFKAQLQRSIKTLSFNYSI